MANHITEITQFSVLPYGESCNVMNKHMSKYQNLTQQQINNCIFISIGIHALGFLVFN